MGAAKILACDSAFSKCVREAADWTCQRCGAKHEEGSMGLHCAHFHTRGKWGTRFDPGNVAALCYGCHSYIDSRPLEKLEFFKGYLGDGMVEIINEKAQKPAHGMKKQKREIAKHYREELERLRQERMAGAMGRLRVIGYE